MPIPTDDHVDLFRPRERDEVVIGWIASDAGHRRRISAGGRLSLDPSYQLARSGLIEPPAELRAQGDTTQLCDQFRTDDDLDLVFQPRIDDTAGR